MSGDSRRGEDSLLSVVIPVYNEEVVLPRLFERLMRSLDSVGVPHELIFVNDGSTDATAAVLQRFCSSQPGSVLITLSRNFGHQASITAGLQASRGDCVVIMDADLQDPPELIPQLVARWRGGDDVVVARRRSRAESRLRRALFAAFYRAFSLLSDHPLELAAGVFGLMDRAVVAHMLRMSEKNRYIPGMRSWLGFKEGEVPYDRSDRAAGKPKQTIGKLLRYGFDAIFSFSYKPLRVIWVCGSLISAFCFMYAFVLVALRILQINVVPGFTTPTIAILFLGGVQLIAVGILGEYLGRIYDEVKQRPLFVVRNEFRHPDAPAAPLRGSP